MNDEQFALWAVVEIFGHKVIAGKVTKETTLFPLLRIDVPETSAFPAYTVEYGPTAIFDITYVSEEVARRTAETLKVNPIAVYVPDLITVEQHQKAIDHLQAEIEKLRQFKGLPAPAEDDEEDDLEGDEKNDRGDY